MCYMTVALWLGQHGQLFSNLSQALIWTHTLGSRLCVWREQQRFWVQAGRVLSALPGSVKLSLTCLILAQRLRNLHPDGNRLWWVQGLYLLSAEELKPLVSFFGLWCGVDGPSEILCDAMAVARKKIISNLFYLFCIFSLTSLCCTWIKCPFEE